MPRKQPAQRQREDLNLENDVNPPTQTRYCEACERLVTGPCSSVDCSTPERPWTAPAVLYRAVVALPDDVAVQPRQERIVFFEAPSMYSTYVYLEVMLSWVWSIPANGWFREGRIYNIWSEDELFCSSTGEGDTRLFEIAWGGPKGVTYADPADVDMFVTPRTRARLDKALATIAANDKTRSAAAKHVLRRMQEDGRLAYLMDPLTTSYELLTQEVATATGQDVAQFRKTFEATLKYTEWPRNNSNERTRGRFAV